MVILISVTHHVVVASLPSGCTSAGSGSLPGRGIKTFILEVSEPLVILLGLRPCGLGLGLALIIGNGNIRGNLKCCISDILFLTSIVEY